MKSNGKANVDPLLFCNWIWKRKILLLYGRFSGFADILNFTPFPDYLFMKRKILYSLLVLFLLSDLIYSFAQHLSQPLDGDMAWNIVPTESVKPILASPLGFDALVHHRSYPNPNRFFCHYSMREYFLHAPVFLQHFTDPVNSVYLACALFKSVLQFFLIFLLAAAITGTVNPLRMEFLIAAALVTPFFQTEGYHNYMGIIDRCTSYTFFYALPCALLLLYFLPLIFQYYHDKKPGAMPLIYILWIPFALVLCLSGPLNPGVALILAVLLFAGSILKNYSQLPPGNVFIRGLTSVRGIPRNYWFCLLPLALFALYSLFLGRYNLHNVSVPLGELYSRLPAGILNPLTRKLGFPVLLSILLLNYLIIRRYYKNEGGLKILSVFTWIAIFSILYILLLPLGGYREYRHNVLRYDTLMPVTISLIFLFGASTLFILNHLSKPGKRWYIPVISGVLLLFTINDEPRFDKNQCERNALREISESTSTIVPLTGNCTVLSWVKVIRPGDSQLNGDLLVLWNITIERKLFYNEQ